MIVGSFLFFLGLFILVGIASIIKSRGTSRDYLLAGHSMQPWLVGLSAVATTNSGFMFTGMIGYTYAVGLSSVWVVIPWIVGDFLASCFVHKRLRITTEKRDVLTFSGVLSHWHGNNYVFVRRISAIIIILFLGTYAAAQLGAGSKALHVLFGWDYKAGAIIGSLIVMVYCFAGGIRASIWTDVAQSAVIIVSMASLSYAAVTHAGGFSSMLDQLVNVSPTYMSWFPDNMLFGPVLGGVLLVLSWTMAGVGVIGQPHIMVRFMAMDCPEDITRVRLYYYGWYTIFSIFTIGAGFAARILLPSMTNFDSELALPMLSKMLLPDMWIGLILAGLFAATMSTADSQILSCSAAFTRDLGIRYKSYIFTKLGTVFVTLVALVIAIYGDDSVFSLVLVAWSVLGSAFAPLLMVYVAGCKPSETTCVAMMLSSLIVVFIWRCCGLSDAVYDIMPGIMAGLFAYLVSRVVDRIYHTPISEYK